MRVLLVCLLLSAACGQSGPSIRAGRTGPPSLVRQGPEPAGVRPVSPPLPVLAVEAPPPTAGQDEASDLKQLGQALDALSAGNLDAAHRLFAGVASHAPKGYVQSHEAGGTLHLRLWSATEFQAYVLWAQSQQRPTEVDWQRSIYPEAYFYLGYIDIEQRDYPTALLNLHAALDLEPNQPQILGEIAVLSSKLGKFQDAVELYDRTLQLRPYLTDRQRARALRGKGIALIDLNQLDDAEALLRESLKYEPENSLAVGELAYVERLRRSGQPPDPSAGNIIIVNPQQQRQIPRSPP